MFKTLCKIVIIFLFAINQASACTLLDKRVCDIEAKLQAATGGHKMKFIVDFTARIAEYEWVIGDADIIHLGDTRDLEDDELYFALAHEFGHSMLHHGRDFIETITPASAKSMSDFEIITTYGQLARNTTITPAVSYRHEYEADAFAAKLLAKEGVDYPKAMDGLLKLRFSSSTHPDKRKRIAEAKKAVEQSLATETASI